MTPAVTTKSMRQEFADTMLNIGKRDKRLVVLIGDISHHILQPFAAGCPGRFFNIGICEPATVNMAAGLAKTGLYPVVHTIAPFIVERSFEQIKLDFGYQKLGVNLVAVGSAFDYAALGVTHHCYDDFALLKNVENSQIFYPASPIEFKALFKQTYRNGLVSYFRLPEMQHGVVFSEKEITAGRGILVKRGKDITVVAVGSQLRTAMSASEALAEKNISVEIIYLHTIKPLDEKLIRSSLRKTHRCLAIEEHSMYGGIADDIRRITNNIDHVECRSINLGDSFIHEYGTYEQHCQRLGLTAENLVGQSLKLLHR